MQGLKNKLLLDGSIEEEIRIALTNESDQLLEYATQLRQKQLLGNIYLGFVEKVEPSLNVAFVNFGEAEDGFLSFDDINHDYYPKRFVRRKYTRIQDVLKKGQPVIVQVTREPSSVKSAMLTTHIALTGKNCILFPKNSDSSGISKNISGDNRKRLKEFIATLDSNTSLIIRTASHSASISEIKQDYVKLTKIWANIVQQTKNQQKPMMLLQEDIMLKKLRAYSKHSVVSVAVEDKKLFETIQAFIAKNLIHFPSVKLVKSVMRKVESQIQNLYSKHVTLPSRGVIIIEHTEALTAIDVNSRHTKERNMEETALKTNLEAANEIVRQIMLRNIGGLIVIDFIDMEDEENIKLVNKEIKNAFKEDKAAITIVGISTLGMMQISRQRLHTSILQKDFEKCEACSGAGVLLKQENVALNLIRQIKNIDGKMRVYATGSVAEIILNKYFKLIANKVIEWQIVKHDHQMCNKIEITK